MCHPGRPGPHGEGHEGSPDLEAFQSAKSELERRPEPIDRAPKHEDKAKNGESSMIRDKTTPRTALAFFFQTSPSILI